MEALQAVSQKLSVAMQAYVSTVILPTPLGFTTVRGLGLQEGQHLAGMAKQLIEHSRHAEHVAVQLPCFSWPKCHMLFKHFRVGMNGL